MENSKPGLSSNPNNIPTIPGKPGKPAPEANPISGYCGGSPGVTGVSDMSSGVYGTALTGPGVTGYSAAGIGVIGCSNSGPGIIGQGNSTGPGLLAIGNYEALVGTDDPYPISMGGGPLPTAVTGLINANPGLAALLEGQVLITNTLSGAAASFDGDLAVNGTSSLNGDLKVTGNTYLNGNLNLLGEVEYAFTVSGDINGLGNINAGGNLVVNGNTVLLGPAALTNDLDITGDLDVTGCVTANDVVISGADCAEEFDLAGGAPLEPGTVVVFNDQGGLEQTNEPYNKRVAGVISGAGAYHPGVILDRREANEGRAPIALIGKVFCKVNADYAPIEVGDPLTTSATSGCAMKATNAAQAFGTVIGKALAPLAQGCGLIPILVTLQ